MHELGAVGLTKPTLGHVLLAIRLARIYQRLHEKKREQDRRNREHRDPKKAMG